ncbi:MAG: caspase family protein [Bacteroidota bacterium]
MLKYSSDVNNPIRVKANIIVKINDTNLASVFDDRETRQSIIDVIKSDFQKNLFFKGEQEVDLQVKVDKLEYSNQPWGLILFPLVIVGLPLGRVSSEIVVIAEVRSPSGQLLRAYRSAQSASKWYNTAYYNSSALVLNDGGIASDVLKSAIEEIKYQIIEDRYKITQSLENPQAPQSGIESAVNVVPFSDVDLNIPKTSMHSPDAVAVVIGISDYQDPDVPKVKYGRQDAGIMRQYLINTLGYDEKNILPRNPDQIITAGVFKTLIRQQLPSYIKPGISDVFIYYSGHGAPNTTTQKAFFVPADCNPNYINEDNGYLVNTFYDDLSKLPCRSLTIVLDACFSGLSGGGGMIVKNASPLFISVQHPLLGKDSTTIFAASLSDQVSNWYPEKRHGLFTYFFLKGLQGAADLNNDGAITIGEMEQYIQDENIAVPYISRREFQRPQMPQVVGKDKQMVLVKH